MIDTSPLISIIVPAYNAAGSLDECLIMLRQQNYENTEIIVIDNNSTDETKKIIEQHRAVDSRITYRFETYRSRGAARNSGVELARGEIIVSTNADCVFDQTWLATLTEPIRSGREQATVGSGYYTSRTYWARQTDYANKQFIRRQVHNGYCASTLDTKNFAIKAELLKSTGFDPKMKTMCDLDLFIRLKNITRIKFLPDAEVGDKNSDSFTEIVKTNFQRAFWTYRVYHKYRPLRPVNNQIMFESISLFNFVTLPFWLLWQCLHNSIKRGFYIVITETSWRCGLFYSWLTC